MGGIRASAPVTTVAGAELAGMSRPSVASLLRRGRHALDEEGDARAGRLWFDAAYRAAEAVQDPVAMGEAALGLAGLWVHEPRIEATHELLMRRIQRALVALDPTSPFGLRLRLRMIAETDYGDGISADTLALTEHVRLNADVATRAEAANLATNASSAPTTPHYATPSPNSSSPTACGTADAPTSSSA